MRCLHRLRCSVRGFARSAHPPPRHDETTSSRWAPLLRIESREGRRHRLAIASQFFGRRGRRLPPIHSNRPPPLNLFREGGPRPHPSSSPAVGTPAHPHSVQANRSNEPLARSWRRCLRLSMPPSAPGAPLPPPGGPMGSPCPRFTRSQLRQRPGLTPPPLGRRVHLRPLWVDCESPPELQPEAQDTQAAASRRRDRRRHTLRRTTFSVSRHTQSLTHSAPIPSPPHTATGQFGPRLNRLDRGRQATSSSGRVRLQLELDGLGCQ